VGDGGNEKDGSQFHGEEQARKRQENESRAQNDNILRARLEKLTDALAALHRDERQAPSKGHGQEAADASPGAPGNVLRLAFRVTSEFVAAVMVGTAIGWGIDHVAGTSPVFLIVFLLMGSAAGFWNVYRIGTEKSGADGSR
jgi:ATP synthase protein I